MTQKRKIMTEEYREKNQPYDIDILPMATKQSKVTKIVNLVAAIALVVVAFSLFIILNWSFAGDRILDVKNDPFPVKTLHDHETSGFIIIISVDMCKNLDISGSLRTSFVGDDKEVFLPEIKEHIAKGCFTSQVPVLIPDGLEKGLYKVRFRVIYDINPIKKNIINEFYSQEFLIDPI